MNFQSVPVSFRPGAVTAGTNINLPAGSPPIGAILRGEIWRLPAATSIADHAAHNHTENTAATYTQNATTANAPAMPHTLSGGNYVVAATVTVVDASTIRLNANTQEGDVLVLWVIPRGSIPSAA